MGRAEGLRTGLGTDWTPGAWDSTVEQRLAELELIYDAAPIGIFLCDREFRLVRVNRHLALDIDGLPVEQHIGRSLSEIVPKLAGAIGPLFRRVLEFGETISRHELEGETPKAPGVKRTWEVSYYPIRGENGDVVAISGIVEDITERKAAAKTRSDEQARLERLLDANLFGVATATAEGVTDANDAFLDLVGYTREDFRREGLDWRKITPAEHLGKDLAGLEQLKKTGTCPAFEKEYVRRDGTRVPVLIGATLLDLEPLRWVAFTLDLSERKASEAHIRHLLEELTHRTKNLISVIQAISHQTVRTSGNLEEFERAFSGRLKALADIHAILVEDSWHGAAADELVRAQLAHCAELVGTRIHLDGPPVFLTAKACQYIGLALHELCTNAMKYGALSNDAGVVTIRWNVQPPDHPELFQIEWLESGGPAVKAPARHGFGERVITQLAAQALDAKVSYALRPQGLRWLLEMPARFPPQREASARAASEPPLAEDMGLGARTSGGVSSAIAWRKR